MVSNTVREPYELAAVNETRYVKYTCKLKGKVSYNLLNPPMVIKATRTPTSKQPSLFMITAEYGATCTEPLHKLTVRCKLEERCFCSISSHEGQTNERTFSKLPERPLKDIGPTYIKVCALFRDP